MTKPKHNRATTPPAEYPPGHFLALVRDSNWPPRFEPRFHTLRLATDKSQIGRPSAAVQSLVSMQARERMCAEGVGWGAGTLTDIMRGTPKTSKPDWMRKMGAA